MKERESQGVTWINPDAKMMNYATSLLAPSKVVLFTFTIDKLDDIQD